MCLLPRTGRILLDPIQKFWNVDDGSALDEPPLPPVKGLTARVVIIAGCVAGILPSIDFNLPLAEQERQRQEYRRHFYVGITRSTDTLVISSATSMQFADAMQAGVSVVNRAGNMAILQASEFIGELGQNAPATTTCQQWRQQLHF